jgi:hypothetical protein
LDNASHLETLLQDLEVVDERLSSTRELNEGNVSVVSAGIVMRPDDINDLPPELMSELSLSETDRLEFDILEIIRSAGGFLPLDKILIGLFRRTGKVHKRPALTSRLYRMVQRERLHNVPGYKGVYSVRAMSQEDVNSVIGFEHIGAALEEAFQDQTES